MSNKKEESYIGKQRKEFKNALMNRYANMSYAVFDWKGIPDEVPKRYPEKWLYELGMCTMFVPEGWDVPVCLQVAQQSVQKNLYGEPTKWRAVAPVSIHGVTDVDLTDRNAVIIRNDYTYKATRPFVEAIVDQMVNVELAMRMNINAQKVPFIFESPDGLGSLQNKQDFIDMMECEPAYFRNKMGEDVFKIWYSQVPFLGKDFIEVYEAYENRILSYIGAYEEPFEKKERLITGEVDNLNEILDIQLKGRLDERKVACEKFNELFEGFDISVSLGRDQFDSESERTDEDSESEQEDGAGSSDGE